MNNLTGENLKLWLYLVRYKEGSQIELSRSDCEKWGLKKSTYYNAKKKLIELHYLVPKGEGSNIYYFYEDLSDYESIPKISTRDVQNLVHDRPKFSREKQYITIYKNNNTPPTPNSDTLPKVKKEDLDKIPGEKVNMGDGVVYSVFTQRAYRIEE